MAFDGAGRRRFDALRSRVALACYGGDRHSYGRVASGRADLVVEAWLAPHDWVALVPLLEDVGGTITDWQGTLLGRHGDGPVPAAATPALHRQALRALDVF